MADYSTLIAALEAAEGPSRELYCRIWQIVAPDRRVLFDPGSVRHNRPAEYGRLADVPLTDWNDWHGLALHIGASEYTTSIDAALTLVPEGLSVSLDWGEQGDGVYAWCEIRVVTPRHGKRRFQCRMAPTPAVALCIAALKARQALETEPRQP